jgi:hypothetical protein
MATDGSLRKGLRAVAFLGIVLAGLTLIVLMVNAGTSRIPSSPKPDTMAKAMCDQFVSRRLLAPSSMKAAGLTDADLVANADGSITVRSFVDAQNVYGAQIRTPYTCTVMSEPEQQTWRLVSLDMQP